MAKKKSAARYCKEELEQIDSDRKFWQSYGNVIGARLYGWTFRHRATFIMPDGSTLPLEQNHIKWAEALIKKTADLTCQEILKQVKEKKKK